MTGFIDPQDWQRLVDAAIAARGDANRLHTRAMLLGYNVSPSTGVEVGDHRVHVGSLGHEPTTSFMVWRIDQTMEDGRTFGSVEDVEQYLGELERLPRFCIDLAADPKVEAVVGDDDVLHVSITDATGSRLSFTMRVVDIENATEFCVHAEPENRPTIGNWREAD